MRFPRLAELTAIVQETEAMRPLPIDSILAQLKHLQENSEQPRQRALSRLTLRRQLVMEWEPGSPPEIQQWVSRVLEVVQAYYDWVHEHDNLQHQPID